MEEHILFLNMFSAYEPDESACDFLSQAQILSADVDAQRRRIDMQIFCPVYIPKSVMQSVCQQIMAVYGLAALQVSPKYPASQMSAMGGDDLMAMFVMENSMTRGYLAGAQWVWDNNTLTVKLRANGKKVIEECIGAVRQRLFEQFDTKVEIVIEAAQNLDGDALFEAMEKMRQSVLNDRQDKDAFRLSARNFAIEKLLLQKGIQPQNKYLFLAL